MLLNNKNFSQNILINYVTKREKIYLLKSIKKIYALNTNKTEYIKYFSAM